MLLQSFTAAAIESKFCATTCKKFPRRSCSLTVKLFAILIENAVPNSTRFFPCVVTIGIIIT